MREVHREQLIEGHTRADTDGHTPLMVASRAGYFELVHLLLSHGACTERSDKDSRTALWYAVKYEQKGAAILLRQARQAAVNDGRIAEAKTKAARAKAELAIRKSANSAGGGAGDHNSEHAEPELSSPPQAASPGPSPRHGKASKSAAAAGGSKKKGQRRSI